MRRRSGAARRGEGEGAVLEQARRAAIAEIEAAQPVRDAAGRMEDDAAGRRVCDAHRLADQILGLAIGVGVIRVGDADLSARIPVARCWR